MFHSLGDNKRDSDPCVYNILILIDGLGKSGKLDPARNLFNDFTTKGSKPSVEVYNVMINSLCRGGLVMEAKELFLKMEQSGCPPNAVTYNYKKKYMFRILN